MITCIYTVIYGCGTNIYHTIEKHDPAELSTFYLEKNEFEKANETIYKELGSRFENIVKGVDANTNWQLLEQELNTEVYRLHDEEGKTSVLNLVSIASSVYAAKAGVDLSTIILKMVDQNIGESSNSDSILLSILPTLPAPEEDVMINANISISLLNSIKEADKSVSDLFKSSVLNISLASLSIKTIDLDATGIFSESELSSLTPDAAIVIYQSISNASSISSIISNRISDTNMDDAVEKTTEIKTLIDNAEGDSLEEKVQNYLGSIAGESKL